MKLKDVFQIGRSFLIVFFISVLCFGCAAVGGNPLVKKSISNIAVPTIEDLVSVGLRHDDLVIVQSLLEANLALLETLSKNSPNNRDLLAITSKLYGYYSFGFVVADEYEDIDDEKRKERLDRARKLYWHGIDYGMKALKTNANFRNALENNVPFREALFFLSKEDLPAAYGAAFNMGLILICSLDVPKVLAISNDYVDLTKWLIDTDETFEYGTPHVLLGVFYAIMPLVGGGGPEKARAEFEKAIAISPDFLVNHFFFARYYPTLVLDEKIFDRELNTVFDFKMDKLKPVRALNEVALKKIKEINKNRDFYF